MGKRDFAPEAHEPSAQKMADKSAQNPCLRQARLSTKCVGEQAGTTPCPKLSASVFQRAIDNFRIPPHFGGTPPFKLFLPAIQRRDSQFGSELSSLCLLSSAELEVGTAHLHFRLHCIPADKLFRRVNGILRQRRMSLPPKKWRTSRLRTPACGRLA